MKISVSHTNIFTNLLFYLQKKTNNKKAFSSLNTAFKNLKKVSLQHF